jgi:hypothetical protein
MGRGHGVPVADGVFPRHFLARLRSDRILIFPLEPYPSRILLRLPSTESSTSIMRGRRRLADRSSSR